MSTTPCGQNRGRLSHSVGDHLNPVALNRSPCSLVNSRAQQKPNVTAHQLSAPSKGMPPMSRKNLRPVQRGLAACLRRGALVDDPKLHPRKAGRHPAMTGGQCRSHRHPHSQTACQETDALCNQLPFNELRHSPTCRTRSWGMAICKTRRERRGNLRGVRIAVAAGRSKRARTPSAQQVSGRTHADTETGWQLFNREDRRPQCIVLACLWMMRN